MVNSLSSSRSPSSIWHSQPIVPSQNTFLSRFRDPSHPGFLTLPWHSLPSPLLAFPKIPKCLQHSSFLPLSPGVILPNCVALKTLHTQVSDLLLQLYFFPDPQTSVCNCLLNDSILVSKRQPRLSIFKSDLLISLLKSAHPLLPSPHLSKKCLSHPL